MDTEIGCGFLRALTPWCALSSASKPDDLELVDGTAASLVSPEVGGGCLCAGGGEFLEWSFYQDEGGEHQINLISFNLTSCPPCVLTTPVGHIAG